MSFLNEVFFHYYFYLIVIIIYLLKLKNTQLIKLNVIDDIESFLEFLILIFQEFLFNQIHLK